MATAPSTLTMFLVLPSWQRQRKIKQKKTPAIFGVFNPHTIAIRLTNIILGREFLKFSSRSKNTNRHARETIGKESFARIRVLIYRLILSRWILESYQK